MDAFHRMGAVTLRKREPHYGFDLNAGPVFSTRADGSWFIASRAIDAWTMGDPFRIHDPTKYRDEGLEEAMNQLLSALVENAGTAFRSEP